MKIIELRAENVKRLRAFHIKPDGSSVIVTGKNGVGKSTALDLVEYAFGGKGSVPSEPVTRGEKKAIIVATTEDLVVTRKFSSSGNSTIEVTNREGLKFPSPQSMLDRLLGSLSFDPLEFSRMKPRDQLSTMKDALGLDFTGLDAKRDAAYQKRRDINRDLVATNARLDANAPKHDDALESMVSVVDLAEELEARKAENAKQEERKNSLVSMANAQSQAIVRIASLEREINEQKEELRRWVRERKDMSQQVNADQPCDEQEVRDQIANAEDQNRKCQENKHRSALEAMASTQRAASDRLSSAIHRVDNEKAEAIAIAGMPIDGLGMGEEGVTLNDLPLEQASGAEKLRVSVALGIALNPEMRVLLIRDGSLLDEDSLRMVSEMADEKDAQLFIERVGTDEEVRVIIEGTDDEE